MTKTAKTTWSAWEQDNIIKGLEFSAECETLAEYFARLKKYLKLIHK